MGTSTANIPILLQFSEDCYKNLQRAIECYNDTGHVEYTLEFIEQAFRSSKIAEFFYNQNFQHGELKVFEDFIHEFTDLCMTYLADFKKEEELVWSVDRVKGLETLMEQLRAELAQK